MPGEAARTGDGAAVAGGFFRLIEIDAAAAGDHPDTWDRIRAGDLHGAVIHGVYPAAVTEAVVARLERHDPPFLKTWFPPAFHSWFYGRNLNLAEPGLPGYFAEAAVFNDQLAALFPPGLGPAAHLAAVLAALDHGRPFRAAPGPRPGESYMFATLRAHLEGGHIPPHCDNELALRPSYAHLLEIVEPHIYSFVLTLALAEAGGALEVFDRRYDPLAARLTSDDAARPPFDDLDRLPCARFRIPPGSVIVLDSGRYLHRVSPVEGKRKRWTACSFMALSRARTATYCWG